MKGLNASDIGAVFLKETRSCLRDRNVLIYSVLLPLALYPALLWGFMQMMLYQAGKTEQAFSRISVMGDEAAGGRIADLVKKEKEERVDLRKVGKPEDAIKKGDLDAAIRFSAGASGALKADLLFDGSKELSEQAKKRGSKVLDDFREEKIRQKASELNIPNAELEGFTLEKIDVASPARMGAFIMGILMPFILIIMGSGGALYPAIDLTVGERERNTWETLICSATARVNLASGKFLAVVAFSFFAMLLNLGSMMASMGVIFGSLPAAERFEFKFPWNAFPILVPGILLISIFFSASMMLFASFAKTFREGQSYVTPFYMVSFMPALVAMSPGAELNMKTALIPVANIALLFRDALTGKFNLPAIGVTFAVLGICCAAAIALSSKMIRQEEFILGTHEGTLWKQLRGTFFKRKGTKKQ